MTIGILTSGGDAPGMNAAIRAVTRAGIYNGFRIKGIYRGYEGLIRGEVKEFTTEDVSGIITRGGTILKTARCKDFMTVEGRQKAYETCRMEEIDAVLSQESGMIEEYNDIRTRQLISNIKVLDKERLLIRFKDGTESSQHIGKGNA